MNTITIAGRLTREPETKLLSDGTTVCNISVAVDKPGKKDDSDFFNVSIFGKSGESAAQYLAKGRWVAVSGSMQSRKADDGKVWWTIRADKWSFVGPKPATGDQAMRVPTTKAQGQYEDDDIPAF